MRPLIWLAIPFLAGTILPGQESSKPVPRAVLKAINAVMDGWHQAAAQWDEEKFFSYLAPEALFIGMDQKERWAKEEFRKIAHPWFENHATWNFRPFQRSVSFSPNGDVAWFDEGIDMAGAGTARGTGVLVKSESTWLIAQYTLSLPIPRQVFPEVLAVVNTQKPSQPSPEPGKEDPSKSSK